jgi:thymidylate kinase
MNGIILEGIPCTGKSTLLRALRAHPALAPRQSLLVLSDLYTERAADGAPERFEHHMYRLLAAVEPLRVLTVESEALRGVDSARLIYLFERFHLTNILRHAGGDLDMLRRVEGMMRFYQPLTVLLHLAPELIEERLRSAGEAAWRAHGDDVAAAAARLAALQEDYVRLAAACTLPTVTIAADDEALERVAELVIRRSES